MNTVLPSSRSTESSRSHGGIFHQRKPSLTTICPPPDKRIEKRRNSTQYTIRTNSNKRDWFVKIFDMPVIQLVGWTYIVICFCLSTIHLISTFSLLDPNSGKIKNKKKILMHTKNIKKSERS